MKERKRFRVMDTDTDLLLGPQYITAQEALDLYLQNHATCAAIMQEFRYNAAGDIVWDNRSVAEMLVAKQPQQVGAFKDLGFTTVWECSGCYALVVDKRAHMERCLWSEDPRVREQD